MPTGAANIQVLILYSVAHTVVRYGCKIVNRIASQEFAKITPFFISQETRMRFRLHTAQEQPQFGLVARVAPTCSVTTTSIPANRRDTNWEVESHMATVLQR